MPAYTVAVKRFFRALIILICTAGAVLALTYAGIDLYGYKQQSERADVICLFGAAVWGSSPSPELEARILWATQLYREGRAPLLFLSGGPTGSNLSESDVMGAVAVKQGVPRSALVLDNAGITTAQTLTDLKHYMQGERSDLMPDGLIALSHGTNHGAGPTVRLAGIHQPTCRDACLAQCPAESKSNGPRGACIVQGPGCLRPVA